MTTMMDRPQGTSESSADAALSVRHLWKIFGKGADKILGSPDAELPRPELKE